MDGVSLRGRGWLRALGEKFWSNTAGLEVAYPPTYLLCRANHQFRTRMSDKGFAAALT